MKLYMFQTVPPSIISSFFHCTHSNVICHTACEQDQDGTSWSCLQAISKPVWHILMLCVQWKTAHDGQRNCLKHVEFHSKNKFEKFLHPVGFIIRIYHDAWSPERKKKLQVFWDVTKCCWATCFWHWKRMQCPQELKKIVFLDCLYQW